MRCEEWRAGVVSLSVRLCIWHYAEKMNVTGVATRSFKWM